MLKVTSYHESHFASPPLYIHLDASGKYITITIPMAACSLAFSSAKNNPSPLASATKES